MFVNNNRYESLPEINSNLKKNINSNYKWFCFVFFNFCFFLSCFRLKYKNNYDENILQIPLFKNKLIEENFFIIDSNNLENVTQHMYGYTITKNGFLTDNYYRKLGHYEEPGSLGVYIMIRLEGNEIRIKQDYYGSFGLYIFEEKDTKYFAISHSFLLLEEYLVEKKNISFNKEFSDNFISSWLCTPSIYETMIKEITRLPSNAMIIINKIDKTFKISKIDYKENTIPLESERGLKIIDKWVDKWTYIIRSLKKQTDNIYFDLTGGFDSRVILSIVLNSGLDINNMSFNTLQTNSQGYDEDLIIAKNISSYFGFELNKLNLDKNYTKWSPKDTLFCSMYSKLGFHKEFYLERGFFTKPRFAFTGGGGDFIKGGPGYPIDKFIEMLSKGSKDIIGLKEEFYKSSIKVFQRSLTILKKEKKFHNDYEISSLLNRRFNSNHFGKKALEGYLANRYFIQPLIDPDIIKIKYNISCESSHDLIAYIYVRFAHDLINFPFQGNRILNLESLKKANELNNKLPHYIIKSDYNDNYYIDKEKLSPIPQTQNFKSAEEYFWKLFKSRYFIQVINSAYNNSVYDWAKGYVQKSHFFALKHGYGLLAVAVTLEHLSLNQKYMRKLKYEICFGEKYGIMYFLTNIKY